MYKIILSVAISLAFLVSGVIRSEASSGPCISSYTTQSSSVDLGGGCVLSIQSGNDGTVVKITKIEGDNKVVSEYIQVSTGEKAEINSQKSSSDNSSNSYTNDNTLDGKKESSGVVGIVSDVYTTTKDFVGSTIDSVLVGLGLKDSVEDRINKSEPGQDLPSEEDNMNAVNEANMQDLINDRTDASDIDDVIYSAEVDNIINDAVEKDNNAQAAEDMGFTPDNGPDLEPFGGSDPTFIPDQTSDVSDVSNELASNGTEDNSSESGSSESASASIGGLIDDVIGGVKKGFDDLFDLSSD